MAAAATTLHTADGVRLAAGWWEPASATGDAVVVVHGFAARKDQPAVVDMARHLAAAGHAVLTYDSRGHGESGGLCTLGELERHDVDAAVTEAAAHADRVVVVGTSMGGVAVLNHMASAAGELANGAGARGAVVVATPARWQIPRTWRGAASVMITQTGAGRAVAARRFQTRIAVRPDRGAPPVERICLVGRPVAVVHGLADRFLPPAAATALFTAAHEPRRLDLVPGMGHGFCAAALGPVESAVAWVMRTALAGTV
ncbi:MAG TPA: alpha/beta hydrolase [Acidimicrobiales bacterium]|nr:alpha/beta hydrolase [Acidimicrobiales bacterium]